jgi:hypothetical protein
VAPRFGDQLLAGRPDRRRVRQVARPGRLQRPGIGLRRGPPASVIAASLYERFESRDNGAFTGKILSAMRSEFGGHNEKKA